MTYEGVATVAVADEHNECMGMQPWLNNIIQILQHCCTVLLALTLYCVPLRCNTLNGKGHLCSQSARLPLQQEERQRQKRGSAVIANIFVCCR